MATTLNNVVSYLKTTLQTDSDLNGNVEFTYKQNPIPSFKNYGIHIHLSYQPMKEQRAHKIGPLLLETWYINLDVIINRAFKAETSLSDAKGVSYWENRITDLLLHGTNNGAFRDSSWQVLDIEGADGAQILRGLFTCEIENRYT